MCISCGLSVRENFIIGGIVNFWFLRGSIFALKSRLSRNQHFQQETVYNFFAPWFPFVHLVHTSAGTHYFIHNAICMLCIIIKKSNLCISSGRSVHLIWTCCEMSILVESSFLKIARIYQHLQFSHFPQLDFLKFRFFWNI